METLSQYSLGSRRPSNATFSWSAAPSRIPQDALAYSSLFDVADVYVVNASAPGLALPLQFCAGAWQRPKLL